MSAVAMNHREDIFQPLFAQLGAERQAEPVFVRALREQAWQDYQTLGVPTTRHEQWRFTDLSALADVSLQRALDTPVDNANLPAVLSESAIRLVFINGRFAPALSDVGAVLPEGIIVSSLANAFTQYPEQLAMHLGSVNKTSKDVFAVLNTALLEDGVFVYLPAGKVLAQPIQLVFYASGKNSLNAPRNLIVLERAAQATIVEQYTGEGFYLSCPYTEIKLADGAVCQHHKVQQESSSAYHLANLHTMQARDSSLTSHLLTTSGLLNRCDVYACLNGTGANNTLHGLTLVEEGELADYHVIVEHAASHGTSQQVFKGVLNGKSRAVFDGLIKVVQDAQKTDASQSSRNLLLSQRALANANPRLEILADDVKCAHGSTIGFLDEDALFYLRSRGLPEQQARALLVYAFANEQIDAIQLTPLREQLAQLLVDRFNK